MATVPTFLHSNRSLDRIAAAKREDIVKTATDLVAVPWIKRGFWMAEPGDIVVRGRFDLTGADGVTPWPSILIELRRRPSHAGQADRKALVAVYVNAAGAWEVSEREDDRIPWKIYRGDREGAPSVLNGDKPSDAPKAP